MTGQHDGTSGPASRGRSLYVSIALFASQIGCLSLVIIVAALLGGRWLDRLLGTDPILTVLLMVGSVPVVLAVSVWLAKRTTSNLKLVSGDDRAGRTQDREIQEDP